MKLGTETGSLINHVMSRCANDEPEEGMGCTILGWTDRHPGTIIHVDNARTKTIMFVREDDAVRLDNNGMSETQSYEYTPNPNGRLYTFQRQKNGSWLEVRVGESGRYKRTGGSRAVIGHREKYYDYSF